MNLTKEIFRPTAYGEALLYRYIHEDIDDVMKDFDEERTAAGAVRNEVIARILARRLYIRHGYRKAY